MMITSVSVFKAKGLKAIVKLLKTSACPFLRTYK